MVGAEPDGGCRGRARRPRCAVAARAERALGAGVIVDPRGIALTSARAVLEDPEFDVVLADGTTLRATVLGVDRRTDVAVLQLASGGRVVGFAGHDLGRLLLRKIEVDEFVPPPLRGRAGH